MSTTQVDPSSADWYAEVIIGKDGEDTTYNYAYYAGDRPTAARLRQDLVPDGWTKLEHTVKGTGR